MKIHTIVAYITSVLLALACPSLAAGQYFEENPSFPRGDYRIIDVDNVWTGVPVKYSAVMSNGLIFLAYYDPDRWFTLTVVSPDRGVLYRHKLPDRYGGWDGHNYTTVAADADGVIHVAGNMHGDPLKYFRLAPPFDRPVSAHMTGIHESRVTYPFFYLTDKKELIFSYREGQAGDGAWYFNKWNGKLWTRLSDGPTMTDSYEGRSVNAYPCVARGRDGAYYVAIQWRYLGGITQNFRITFVKTNDFQVWRTIDDKPVQLPITPDNSSIVVNTGPDKGLKSCAISVDDVGRPYIAYTRLDDSGRNAGFVARGSKSGWIETEVVEYSRGEELRRRQVPIGVRAVTLNEGTATACFRIRRKGLQCRTLTDDLSVGAAVASPDFSLSNLIAMPDGLTAAVQNVVRVRRMDGAPSQSFIVWPSQRQRRWKCADDTPTACTPPPKSLRLLLRP